MMPAMRDDAMLRPRMRKKLIAGVDQRRDRANTVQVRLGDMRNVRMSVVPWRMTHTTDRGKEEASGGTVQLEAVPDVLLVRGGEAASAGEVATAADGEHTIPAMELVIEVIGIAEEIAIAIAAVSVLRLDESAKKVPRT